MKKKPRLLAVLLAAVMLLVLCTACGDSATSAGNPAQSEPTAADSSTAPAEQSSQAAPQEDSAAASEQSSALEEISPPLTDETVTLTWFTSLLSANDRKYLDSMADNVALQHLEELTNVTIEPIESDSETYSEKLNIMIASGGYTDLIYNAVDFVNSPDQMVRDEVFLDITELIASDMPNYQKVLNDDQDFALETKTANGAIVAVYEYVPEPAGENLGLFIRQDWLDDCGLSLPVTYDDWDQVLAAFTNEKGATLAFGVQQSGIPINETFSAGYGVALSPGYVTFQEDGYPFYQVDGTVKCGYLEDGFTDYITMMHDWYEKGYIGNDFVSKEMPDAYADDLMAQKTGAFYFYRDACDVLGGMAGGTVVPCPSPVKEAGDTLHIGGYMSHVGDYSNTITSQCEYPKLAARFMDYLYSEDGYYLTNYGVENVSWTMESGEPQFMDVVTDPAGVTGDEGFSTNIALDVYAFRRLGGQYNPNRASAVYSDTFNSLTSVWYGNRDANNDIPTYVTLSEEDQTQFDRTWTDIQTLILESVAKFINGGKSLSEIGSFQDQLRQMGIEDCIGYYQSAYDTYVK